MKTEIEVVEKRVNQVIQSPVTDGGVIRTGVSHRAAAGENFDDMYLEVGWERLGLETAFGEQEGPCLLLVLGT